VDGGTRNGGRKERGRRKGDGRMRDEGMKRWRDGEMEGWRDGGMKGWREEQEGTYFTMRSVFFFKKPSTLSSSTDIISNPFLLAKKI
jgi:hypothetical protein